MATHLKGPAKPRATQKLAPISLKDELAADEPVEAPGDVSFVAPTESAANVAEPETMETVEILEPAAASEPVAPVEPVVAAVTASLAPPALIAPEAPATEGASAEIDPSALLLETFDLFNENASAVLDFALALGKAQSVGDALELQSRFASERYSSLVRQAGEFAELTRRLAVQSSPMKLSFSAFIA